MSEDLPALRVRRLERRAEGACATAANLCLVFALMLDPDGRRGGVELELAVGFCTFVGLSLMFVAWALGRPPLHTGGILRITDDALHLGEGGGAAVVPRGAIVSGARHATPAWRCELHLRGGIVLVVDALDASPDAISRLLAMLSLDAQHRAVTFATTTATTPAYRATWLLGGALLAVTAAFPREADAPAWLVPTLLLVSAPLAWALAAETLGPRVTVGVDGLRACRPWRERFVAWSEVADVSAAGALVLTLTSGECLRLGWANASTAALRLRIEEARGVAAAGAAGVAATARGGRSVEQWRAAMGALVAGTGYRDEAVDEGALACVLHGSAMGDERVGAALALVAADRARHATGVRVAAAAVADERVRVVLEAIAEGEVSDATLRRVAG